MIELFNNHFFSSVGDYRTQEKHSDQKPLTSSHKAPRPDNTEEKLSIQKNMNKQVVAKFSEKIDE